MKIPVNLGGNKQMNERVKEIAEGEERERKLTHKAWMRSPSISSLLLKL